MFGLFNKYIKVVFSSILWIVPLHSMEEGPARYPKALLLNSGYGVLDRTLLMNGFQIVASVAEKAGRAELNKYNNCDRLTNQSHHYPVIVGDINSSKIQRDILSAIASSGGDQSVDLVYNFIDKGGIKEGKLTLLSTLAIASKMVKGSPDNLQMDLPKIICLEIMRRQCQVLWNVATQETLYTESIQPYYTPLKTKDISFADYGLPIRTERAFVFLIRNDLVDGTETNLEETFLPKKPEEKDGIPPVKGAQQAFEEMSEKFDEKELPRDWWQQEDPKGDIIPLHTSLNELTDDIKTVLSHLEPGQSFASIKCIALQPELDKRCGKCVTCQFYREGFNKKFSQGRERRSHKDRPVLNLDSNFYAWYKYPHFYAHRPFSFFELAVLNGLMEVSPFSLDLVKAGKAVNLPKSHYGNTIFEVTSPAFLKPVVKNIFNFLQAKGANVYKEGPLPMDLSLLPRFLSINIPTPFTMWRFIAQNPEEISLEAPGDKLTPCLGEVKESTWNQYLSLLEAEGLKTGYLNKEGTLINLAFKISKQQTPSQTKRIISEEHQRVQNAVKKNVKTFQNLIDLYRSVAVPQQWAPILTKLDTKLSGYIQTFLEKSTSKRSFSYSHFFQRKEHTKIFLAMISVVENYMDAYEIQKLPPLINTTTLQVYRPAQIVPPTPYSYGVPSTPYSQGVPPTPVSGFRSVIPREKPLPSVTPMVTSTTISGNPKRAQVIIVSPNTNGYTQTTTQKERDYSSIDLSPHLVLTDNLGETEATANSSSPIYIIDGHSDSSRSSPQQPETLPSLKRNHGVAFRKPEGSSDSTQSTKDLMAAPSPKRAHRENLEFTLEISQEAQRDKLTPCTGEVKESTWNQYLSLLEAEGLKTAPLDKGGALFTLAFKINKEIKRIKIKRVLSERFERKHTYIINNVNLFQKLLDLYRSVAVPQQWASKLPELDALLSGHISSISDNNKGKRFNYANVFGIKKHAKVFSTMISIVEEYIKTHKIQKLPPLIDTTTRQVSNSTQTPSPSWAAFVGIIPHEKPLLPAATMVTQTTTQKERDDLPVALSDEEADDSQIRSPQLVLADEFGEQESAPNPPSPLYIQIEEDSDLSRSSPKRARTENPEYVLKDPLVFKHLRDLVSLFEKEDTKSSQLYYLGQMKNQIEFLTDQLKNSKG